MTKIQFDLILGRMDAANLKPLLSFAWTGADTGDYMPAGGLPSGAKARRIFVVLTAAASITINEHTKTAGGSAEEYTFDAPIGTYLPDTTRIEYSGGVAITIFYTL